MDHRIGLLLSLLAATCLCGCGGSTSTSSSSTSSSLHIVASQTAIQVGGAQQLKAVLTNADGSTTDVTANATWSSASNSATVTPGGRVTGATPGSATITAKYQHLSSSAQMQVTKLFGVSACCPNQFLLLTTSMGQFRAVQSIGDELSGFFGSAGDAQNHRFYVPRWDSTTGIWSLLTLDTQTGNLINTLGLSSSGGFDWQWDALPQELLLITTLSSNNSTNDLVSLDPATAAVTPILQLGDMSVSFNTTSAFDSANRIYYCIQFSSTNQASLIAVDVAAGTIRSELPLTAPAPFVMDWDSSSGLIYGVAGNNFVSIEPTTGNVQVKGMIGDSNTNFDSFLSAIDSVRRRFYVVEVVTSPSGPNTDTIVGIDLDSGSVVENLPLSTGIILLGAEAASQ
jgi:hypothetical protein